MPSDKRARQRAMRQVKVASEQRRANRVRLFRRSASGLVVVGIVIALVVVLSSSPTKSAKSTTTTTPSSTTSSTTTTTTSPTTQKAVAPVCPPAGGSATRVLAFTKAPPLCINTADTYEANVTTDIGSFVIKLLTQSSPTAVNNFVFLSRYHFYNSTIFHRVIPGFMNQGGDPTGTGTGGPGYSWTGNTPNAACASAQNCYPIGGVAMANSGTTSSNGSQFFIVTGAAGEQLPPSYTLFGQVVSGMSVVQKINSDGNSNSAANGVPPKVTHHIVTITITQATQ